MESDNRTKRNNKKQNEPVDKSKEIIEKYMNINYSSLTEDDAEKIKNFYAFRLEEIKKFKEAQDIKELYNLGISTLNKNSGLEIEVQTLENKHSTLQNESKKTKEIYSDLTKKLNDKDKLSKMIIEKINTINSEKQRIINEESERRNVIVKETENFVRSLQSKYEDELPEKKRLIEENQLLRGEIDKCIKNSGNLKTMLENQLKEKVKSTEDIENKIKFDLKNKMENMTLSAQKYILENSELKIQIANFKKKNEDLESLVNAFTVEYGKLKNELEKKKKDIILLSAENFDLTNKYKKSFNNTQLLKNAIQENEKVTSQFIAMEKLNKKLLEQFESLQKECSEKGVSLEENI